MRFFVYFEEGGRFDEMSWGLRKFPTHAEAEAYVQERLRASDPEFTPEYVVIEGRELPLKLAGTGALRTVQVGQ